MIRKGIEHGENYLDLYCDNKLYGTVFVERLTKDVGNIHFLIFEYSKAIYKRLMKDLESGKRYIKTWGYRSLVCIKYEPDEKYVAFAEMTGMKDRILMMSMEL